MKKIRLVAVVSTAVCVLGLSLVNGCSRDQPVESQVVESVQPDGEVAREIDTCADLANLTLDGVVIDKARFQPAEKPVEGAMMPDFTGAAGGPTPVAGLPAFCRVTGSLQPTEDSDNRFEVWLPKNWDGRFHGTYAGGLAGYINYPDLASGVRAGQAVAATDSGHRMSTPASEWAKGHPDKVRDYAWRGIHEMTVVGKALVNAYYGRGPEHAYFMGCSNGGRQAAMEAFRFPSDYDGVLVGAPDAVFTDTIMTMANTVQAQLPEGAALQPEQIPFLQNEVLKQCDGVDGQTDGLVNDPRQCTLDYSALSCDVSDSTECFTEPQINALKQIHQGARDSEGKRLSFGFPPTGGEVGVPAFFGWEVNVAAGGKPAAAQGESSPADSILQNFAAQPIATARTFDFDSDPARLKTALSDILDAGSDMSAFFERGGKMIMWHGWADAVLAPEATIDYYNDVIANSGPGAEEHVRLFMVPGVQHCGSGPGPDSLGQSGVPLPTTDPEESMGSALQAWVEDGRRPESVIGRFTGGTMQRGAAELEKERLICAYPKMAVLRPGQDPDRASSYVCSVPGEE